YIASAVARGALLIAGTSYRDPDLRHWLHAALKDKPDDRAAIVMLAREGFALTKTQFKMAREVLANQWRAVGIEPVLLEDHADAAQL
ncbi:SIR2 family protein, partial [Mycobacterium tuberculosis]|nr:SIR2 family protein [Mycobacterium tuberculosis]